MKRTINIEFKRYLKEISHMLPNSYIDKAQFLKDLNENIELYLKEHKDATWQDVIEEFGTSAEVAGSIISNHPDADNISAMRSRQHLHFIIIVICTAVILSLLGYEYYWVHFKMYRTSPTHYIYQGTEISSEEFSEKMDY